MARRVFFSFYNKGDFARADVVRNRHARDGGTAEGFHDIAVWRETEQRGEDGVRAMIANGIAASSVTAVLIGTETANRKYMDFEIAQTLANGNGLLGLYIHDIPDRDGKTSAK